MAVKKAPEVIEEMGYTVHTLNNDNPNGCAIKLKPFMTKVNNSEYDCGKLDDTDIIKEEPTDVEITYIIVIMSDDMVVNAIITPVLPENAKDSKINSVSKRTLEKKFAEMFMYGLQEKYALDGFYNSQEEDSWVDSIDSIDSSAE